VLELPSLYDRPGLYAASPEDAPRFIALGRAGARLALEGRFDALVAHDWHAALAIGSLRLASPDAAASRVATVQVVHNGAHIGRFAASEMARTGLPPETFQPEGVEFYGDLCLLKAGLVAADRVVAVSPRYAQELTTPECGGGLDGVYRAASSRLVGIANGIDTRRFDPSHDTALAAPFSAERRQGRAVCRERLCAELRLDATGAGRLFAAVGRLSPQKGWDVLAASLDAMVADGASVALLGDGDRDIALQLEQAVRRHPGRVVFERGWNEPLSRRLYAGADAVLAPSRFEPCGLVQLLAQRYGSLPVAHRVGGFVDTIEDGVSGVLFDPLEPAALVAATRRATGMLTAPGAEALRESLLRLDVSWRESARHWEALLVDALRGRAHG
jgi:starch synthase